MKKNILSIINLICVIIVIITLLYQYYEIGNVTTDGWFTLLFVFGVSMTQINYWKKYFSKD
ncbi:MAG: hypothetical protein CMG50_03190 [Candidatus Marinimicrobia bacterium]|nr:hypothetical protein [Candidatus Neomarinimicrobiota bacterium]